MKFQLNNDVLKAAVLQSRMTLAEIADKGKLTAGTISKLLNQANRKCTLRTISNLCNVLNIEPTALVKI